MYAPDTHRGQKKALDPLDVMAVSHHVDSGNQTWVLCRGNKCSDFINCAFSLRIKKYLLFLCVCAYMSLSAPKACWCSLSYRQCEPPDGDAKAQVLCKSSKHF